MNIESSHARHDNTRIAMTCQPCSIIRRLRMEPPNPPERMMVGACVRLLADWSVFLRWTLRSTCSPTVDSDVPSASPGRDFGPPPHHGAWASASEDVCVLRTVTRARESGRKSAHVCASPLSLAATKKNKQRELFNLVSLNPSTHRPRSRTYIHDKTEIASV